MEKKSKNGWEIQTGYLIWEGEVYLVENKSKLNNFLEQETIRLSPAKIFKKSLISFLDKYICKRCQFWDSDDHWCRGIGKGKDYACIPLEILYKCLQNLSVSSGCRNEILGVIISEFEKNREEEEGNL